MMSTDNDPTDHSDLDDDLLRMSADAMAILNSLSNEVNDEGTNKSKKKKEIVHIDNLDVDHDDYSDDDDDDIHDDDDDTIGDDSITKELRSLRDVQKEMERELNSQDVNAMQEAITKLKQQPLSPLNSPMSSPRSGKSLKRLGKDDRLIIQRILKEEKEKARPTNLLLRYIEKYSLYGPGNVGCGPNVSFSLLTSAVGVWSILIGLSYQVLNAEF